MIELIILIIFIVVVFIIFNFNKNSSKNPSKNSNNSSVITKKIKPTVILTEFYKDIKLQPYGCFNNLDEKFFQKQMNPYSNNIDSLVIINDDTSDIDIKALIKTVMNNGYDIYAFKILNKYNSMQDGYRKINIEEIATLGKLAGYNYLSIYKINEKTRGKMYLSYSPPMDELSDDKITKSDLPDYTLTPKLNNYTNEIEKAVGKELSCGYPCLPDGKPETFVEKGKTKQYMCGSVGYPTIKTPTRFAVYKIVETI